MLGEPLAAVRPYLAVAQRDGELSTEQVAIIERAITPVDRRGFNPADVDAGEQLLVTHARSFGPEDLKQLADRVVDAIDPDGTLPKDELNPTADTCICGPPKTVPGPGSSGSPESPGPN